MLFDFNPLEDYKAKFEYYVERLIEANIQDRQTRIALVDDLCTAYVEAINEKPAPYMLSQLADYLLKEELSDKSPSKARDIEYNFLSEDQLIRREEKETPFVNFEHSVDTNRSLKKTGTRKNTRNVSM